MPALVWSTTVCVLHLLNIDGYGKYNVHICNRHKYVLLTWHNKTLQCQGIVLLLSPEVGRVWYCIYQITENPIVSPPTSIGLLGSDLDNLMILSAPLLCSFAKCYKRSFSLTRLKCKWTSDINLSPWGVMMLFFMMLSHCSAAGAWLTWALLIHICGSQYRVDADKMSKRVFQGNVRCLSWGKVSPSGCGHFIRKWSRHAAQKARPQKIKCSRNVQYCH